MPIVQGVEKIFSLEPRKILGRHRHYGRSMLGQSHFGDDDIIVKVNVGVPGSHPHVKEIKEIVFSGIYSLKHLNNKRQFMREEYYIPYNPRTIPQQANRGILRDAVSAWQDLTNEQKLVYNNRAKGKNLSGYNIFIGEYVHSH